MPLFLKLVLGIGWLVGGAGALMIGGFLVLASGDTGPYTVNEAMVSKEEFMTFALPVLGSSLVLCLMLVGTSLGLYRGRSWSRPLLLSLATGSALIGIVGALLVGIPLGQGAAAVLMGGLMLASLWWYLYRDDAVVSFFDGLQARPEAASPGS